MSTPMAAPMPLTRLTTSSLGIMGRLLISMLFFLESCSIVLTLSSKKVISLVKVAFLAQRSSFSFLRAENSSLISFISLLLSSSFSDMNFTELEKQLTPLKELFQLYKVFSPQLLRNS
ncbi:hypothetical protein J6590_058004 [Homalodisca vitripennis]|nr:hypothetical protein J6590_058004 [Homalodisca vitripennis]